MSLPSGDEREWLEASAPLGRALAEPLCATKLGHDSCAALHGVWQDLRRLGLAATPQRHAEFFSRFLARGEPSRRPRRVLISAAADSGMLELVVSAHRAAHQAVEPTVVDLCPTPLLLCAWYGARVGIPVRTVATDLVSYHEPEAFDVVCTHSVLRSFPRPAQPAVMARWREWLRPGAALVTVTRIDPDGPEQPSASPEQAGAFAARAEAFTEGGYCTLYTAGRSLAGRGGIDAAIAAACATVVDDEWDHMIAGIAGLDAEGLADEDWALLAALTAEQGRCRIRMRNAQFGRPLGPGALRRAESGSLTPLAFDFERAGFAAP